MKFKQSIKTIIILLVYLAISPASSAEPNAFDYDHVVSAMFWNGLYSSGGWTLYCGFHFKVTRKTDDGKVIEIEHIYPTEWMVAYLKCKNRLQCHEKNKKFDRMESDLHNMYPVSESLVIYRNNLPYGVIDGEDWRFDDCDFEWNAHTVEPRPIARGNIARAIFYMHTTYGLPVDAGMLKILKTWNREDPPSKQEKERNDMIGKLQGQRNRYIDKPLLADKIR